MRGRTVSEKRANIVFIECDSMDGRAFGAMNCAPLKQATPVLDGMAKNGVLFENMYSNNPICCCSRASMLSGQYTFHCHGWNNYKGLPKSRPTLFSELECSGYHTGIFGKTDYVSGEHTIRARVTAWLRTANLRLPEYNMGPPEILDSRERRVNKRDWEHADQSLVWLRENSGTGKPFFLYLGLNLPHPEFRTSNYYLDKIDLKAITIPPKDTYNHPVMEYQRISKAWSHGLDPETVKKVRAIYYAMIAETDEIVGEVVKTVKDLGISGNTYIIFTGDHGEMNMEHEQFYKSNMYEPAVRVPLLVTGPDVKKGLRVNRLVSLIDIFPTLVSLAGIETGAPLGTPLDGHSLAPELLGYGSDLPNRVFSEYHDCSVNASTSMLREDEWKYIAFAGGYEPLLFNLKDDPGEINNLACKLPEKAAEMKKILYGISNLDEVAAHVKEHEQDSFRVWRHEQMDAGTYYKNMARIYSGWDYIKAEDAQPWTEENEKKVIAWLEEMP
jgi:arylsulfatase A-like enzyme